MTTLTPILVTAWKHAGYQGIIISCHALTLQIWLRYEVCVNVLIKALKPVVSLNLSHETKSIWN